jgi:TonB family protein
MRTLRAASFLMSFLLMLGAFSAPVAVGAAPTLHHTCPVPEQAARAIKLAPLVNPDGVVVKVPTTVDIAISLSDTGIVQSTSIQQSSNNGALDRAAIEAARTSTYAPEVANCVVVPGTYIYHAEFGPLHSPLPALTATPPCALGNPNQNARMIDAVVPRYPQERLDQPANVSVKVQLSATGSVLNATVEHSSGIYAVDHAAVRAIQESKFAPQIVDCKGVPGTYRAWLNFTAS